VQDGKVVVGHGLIISQSVRCRRTRDTPARKLDNHRLKHPGFAAQFRSRPHSLSRSKALKCFRWVLANEGKATATTVEDTAEVVTKAMNQTSAKLAADSPATGQKSRP